jgi:hypothetical protein
MSVLSHLDRILTELRQFLELGTVTTIIVRAATLNILAFRERSVTAPPVAAVWEAGHWPPSVQAGPRIKFSD